MFQLLIAKNFHESFLSCLGSIVMNKLKCLGMNMFVNCTFCLHHELSYPIGICCFCVHSLLFTCTIPFAYSFCEWMDYASVYKSMFFQLVICQLIFICICKCGWAILDFALVQTISKKWLCSKERNIKICHFNSFFDEYRLSLLDDPCL